VFGLVQSKDAKVWFSVGCLVWVLSKYAKQGCQANKQARISNQARVKCWVYGAKQG